MDGVQGQYIYGISPDFGAIVYRLNQRAGPWSERTSLTRVQDLRTEVSLCVLLHSIALGDAYLVRPIAMGSVRVCLFMAHFLF